MIFHRFVDSNELTVHRDEDYFNVISHLDAKEVHYQAIFFQVICKFLLWKFALWQILPGILDLYLIQFIFFLQTLLALLRIDLPDFAFVAYYVLWPNIENYCWGVVSPVIVETLCSLSEVLYRALSLRAATLIAGILLTLLFFMLIMTAAMRTMGIWLMVLLRWSK